MLAGAVLVMARSARRGPTVTVAVALLLAGDGSMAGVLKTLAVLVIVVPGTSGALARTTSTTVAVPPAGSAPTVQVMGPVVTQVPCATRTKVVPAGTESVMLTAGASEGPALVAVRV